MACPRQHNVDDQDDDEWLREQLRPRTDEELQLIEDSGYYDPSVSPDAWDGEEEEELCICGKEGTHYIPEAGIWYCGRSRCYRELYEGWMYHNEAGDR